MDMEKSKSSSSKSNCNCECESEGEEQKQKISWRMDTHLVTSGIVGGSRGNIDHEGEGSEELHVATWVCKLKRFYEHGQGEPALLSIAVWCVRGAFGFSRHRKFFMSFKN